MRISGTGEATGDAALVLAARGGDREAFAGIYDRYADRLHDFCFSVLRDSNAAADATQDTFVLAVQRLHQLRDPGKLRAWLFAIARNETMRELRHRRRAEPVEDAGVEVASDHPGPEAAVSEADAGAVVWEAAAGLSERDQVLLHLTVREGLEGQELADAIGVSASHSYVLVSRLRERVERSIGALLVARRGNPDCEGLQTILAGWDGTFSPLVRKRVARHIDRCERCTEAKKKVASPLRLLSAMAVVPAPAALRDETLSRAWRAAAASPLDEPTTLARTTSTREGSGGPGAWKPGRDGFPPSMYPRSRKWVVAAAAAAAVAVIVGGTWLALGGDDTADAVAVASRGGELELELAEPAPLPVPVENDAESSPADDPAGPGDAPDVEPPGATNDPEPGPSPGPAPPAPDATGPSITNLSTAHGEICVEGFGPPETTTATATVTDASGVASVVVTWHQDSVGTKTVPMAKSGTTWTATLGPVVGSGGYPLTWTVTATDVHGDTSQASGPAVSVSYCL